MTNTARRPKAAIRRFDVFAEYQRQQALDEGQSQAQAKGYGIWLAKVVAARRFRAGAAGDGKDGQAGKPADKKDEQPDGKRSRWRSLSGEPQTDRLFDKEIVSRMGRPFYQQVFEPAIREARQAGERYEDIRDSIRRNWKPDGS
jgi:hypothetical protein